MADDDMDSLTATKTERSPLTEIYERVPAPCPGSSPNQETKLERFYKPEKMRTALFKMEQFYLIWQDERTDDQHKKAAKALFEHYRRLALCILVKEMNAEQMHTERVLTPSYIDTMFADFNPYLDASVAVKAEKTS